nr:MAG TPA: hypothetical protein [Caudoviricetes sp.]
MQKIYRPSSYLLLPQKTYRPHEEGLPTFKCKIIDNYT